MESSDSQHGYVDIPAEQFAVMRADGSLPRLLLLCRIVNCLRFAHTAPLEVYNQGTPHASRQLMGSFLLQTGYALEAIDALKSLNQSMHESVAWQTKIVPLFRDPDVQQLERESLRELRNQVVFHFDLSAIERGLDRLPNPEFRLASTSGLSRQAFYFPLADEVAVAFAVSGTDSSREEWLRDVHRWMRLTTELSLRMAEIVESVILEITVANGLEGRWVE